MTRRSLAALGTVILFAAIVSAQTPTPDLTAAEKNQGYSNRTLLAKIRDAQASAEVAAAESTEGVRLRRTIGEGRTLRVLEPAAGESIKEAIDRLRATGRYEFVEPDYVLKADIAPNDPRFVGGEQWGLRNIGQNGGKSGADVSAEDAWGIQLDARSVPVAIIDSGMRLTHQDLAPNLWINSGESGPGQSNNLRDDDGNGYIDDLNGINSNVSLNTSGNGAPIDSIGHGTAVAGVIGATGNNGLGMTGVAWRASLMPLRFLDVSGYGLISDEIECVDYAIAKRARVINASYGSAAYSQAAFEAHKRARDAGIVVVCSAGNGGQNADLTPHYPSGYLLDNIIAVANSTRTDELSAVSDYGTGLTELAAPGTSILTTSAGSDTGYQVVSGTSFSTPMVTGAVALLRARFPSDTHRETINRLLRSVDVLPSLTGKTSTRGRLNIAAALRSTTTRPFHDDFAQRATVVGEAITARSASQFSTREVGEPVHAGTTGNGSLWWTWTAPRSGALTIDTAGSAVDTLLHVYTGNTLSSLSSVASNDEESSSVATSKVSITAVAGTTYQVAVDTKGSASGLVVLRFTLNANNDNFDSAQLLAGLSWSVSADNRTASRETGEPRIRNNAGARSVWYRWIPPVTRRYHFSTYSRDFNTMLGVFTGTSLSALTEVASALTDSDSNYTTSYAGLTFTAVAGTPYYFVVDSEVSSTGTSTAGAFSLSCTDSDWEFVAVGPPGTLATAPDGTLYSVDFYGYLYALAPDGSRKWRYMLTGYGTYSAPALAADGTLYVGDSSGYFYAINPDGTRKWRITARGAIQSSPAVAPDGTIYIRADGGLLYALNPADGSTRWTAPTGTSSITTYSSPVVASDGTIYCAGAASRLHAFTPAGVQKWTFDSDFFYGSPAIAADGTIYIGVAAPTRRLYALRPDGTLKWEYIAGNTVSSSPVIGTDGTIYFGCADKNLYALTPSGELRWTFATSGEIRNSTPLVASDGSLFVGSLDGKVYNVKPDGTLRRTYCTASEIRTTPLLHNGRLYVPSDDFRLYAVETGQVPASSAWPMHRQNLRRSARVELSELTFGVQPAAQTAAVEDKVTFVAGAIGRPPLTYQWLFNGQAITGATGSTLTIESVNHVNGGDYTVRVSDSTGTITSRNAKLAISTPLVLPSVLTAPVAQTTLAGSSITLNVVANGSAPISYQWLRDGAPIAGATSGALVLGGVRTRDSGRYAVVLTNFGGSVTSTAVVVTVNPISRISNLSIRSQVGGDAGPLTVGLTVGGTSVTGTKPVLLRSVGPTLGVFGVTGFLTDPQIKVMSGPTLVAQNDDWAGNATVANTSAAVGAFSLATPDSKDAALAQSIAPGGYTVEIAGANGEGGVALVEAYDASPADTFDIATPRLINVSALTRVGTDSDILIAGFSITGATSKSVLIRAIGPALQLFGVSGALEDPKLEVFAGGAAAIHTNDNWGSGTNAAQIAAAAVRVGAFALPAESRDAVLLVTLQPGSYTAQISGVGNTTGTALVEVYELP